MLVYIILYILIYVHTIGQLIYTIPVYFTKFVRMHFVFVLYFFLEKEKENWSYFWKTNLVTHFRPLIKKTIIYFYAFYNNIFNLVIVFWPYSTFKKIIFYEQNPFFVCKWFFKIIIFTSQNIHNLSSEIRKGC